jgi:hypothetical protein
MMAAVVAATEAVENGIRRQVGFAHTDHLSFGIGILRW